VSLGIGRGSVVVAQGHESLRLPRRFPGGDPTSSLLGYVLDSVWTVSDEIYVVFRDEPDLALVEEIAPSGAKIISVASEAAAVDQVAAGLQACHSELCLVLAGNVPFVKPNLAYELFEAAREYDAAVPRWADGRLEPLLATYRRKSWLRALAAGTPRSLQGVLDSLYGIRFVAVENELKQLDPELHSFFRVEGAGDLQKAEAVAAQSAPRS
jgi:molybdopterin-guanine dinucleotide biosynthesis protein A